MSETIKAVETATGLEKVTNYRAFALLAAMALFIDNALVWVHGSSLLDLYPLMLNPRSTVLLGPISLGMLIVYLAVFSAYVSVLIPMIMQALNIVRKFLQWNSKKRDDGGANYQLISSVESEAIISRDDFTLKRVEAKKVAQRSAIENARASVVALMLLAINFASSLIWEKPTISLIAQKAINLLPFPMESIINISLLIILGCLIVVGFDTEPTSDTIYMPNAKKEPTEITIQAAIRLTCPLLPYQGFFREFGCKVN